MKLTQQELDTKLEKEVDRYAVEVSASPAEIVIIRAAVRLGAAVLLEMAVANSRKDREKTLEKETVQ